MLANCLCIKCMKKSLVSEISFNQSLEQKPVHISFRSNFLELIWQSLFIVIPVHITSALIILSTCWYIYVQRYRKYCSMFGCGVVFNWQLLLVCVGYCRRSTKRSSRYADRDWNRHSGQHSAHSPAHSTGRSPESKFDSVHRESPATSPRTRHVMSPGIAARTRHATAYRSRSPDDYRKSREDVMKWSMDSDYDTSQQQHSVGMVMPSLMLLVVFA